MKFTFQPIAGNTGGGPPLTAFREKDQGPLSVCGGGSVRHQPHHWLVLGLQPSPLWFTHSPAPTPTPRGARSFPLPPSGAGTPAWAPRMLQAGDALPGDRPGPRRAARTHAHSSPIILTAHPEADFIFITILWERILVQRGQNGAGNVSELMGSSNPAQAAYAPSPSQGQTDHPGGALRFLKSRQVHG